MLSSKSAVRSNIVAPDVLNVSPKTAARYLGMGRTTLDKYIRAGLLPAVKQGGCVKIAFADIVAFSKTNQPTPEVALARKQKLTVVAKAVR